MVLHVLQCGRPLCDCLRVPHPHRPGSFPLCEHNPESDLLIAERTGASPEQLEDMALDIAWDRPGKPAKACPF